jgi:hypothetical protein
VNWPSTPNCQPSGVSAARTVAAGTLAPNSRESVRTIEAPTSRSRVPSTSKRPAIADEKRFDARASMPSPWATCCRSSPRTAPRAAYLKPASDNPNSSTVPPPTAAPAIVEGDNCARPLIAGPAPLT